MTEEEILKNNLQDEKHTSSKNTSSKKVENLTAKLYLAIDDLAFSLATEEDEKIRQSEVFKKAVNVIKIVHEMRKNQFEQ